MYHYKEILYPVQDISIFTVLKISNEKIPTVVHTENVEAIPKKYLIEEVTLDHNYIHTNDGADVSYHEYYSRSDASDNDNDDEDDADGFIVPPTFWDITTIPVNLDVENQQYERPPFIPLWDCLLQMNWFKAHDCKTKTAKLSSAGYLEYFCAPWAKHIEGAFVPGPRKKPCAIIVDIQKLQQNVDYFERQDLITLIPKYGYERKNYIDNQQEGGCKVDQKRYRHSI